MSSSRAAGFLCVPVTLLIVACGETGQPLRSAVSPVPQIVQTPHRDLDVVLIVVDTLRADHVHCYGYGRETTPAIDALAAQGTRFADCTAQASWTVPSMVSLLTSRRTVSDFVRLPAARTLADVLHDAGYVTLGFQDNLLLAPGAGFERGFDVYEMEVGSERCEELLASTAGRPLFLYCHFVDPHAPYAPLPEFDVFGRDGGLQHFSDSARRFSAYLQAQPGADDARDLDTTMDAASEVQEQVALYDGDVLQADQRVQYVLDLLARHGRRDRALVIVASDHGECLWEQPEAEAALADDARADPLRRFKAGHNTLLAQSLVHVPLVMSGPDLPRGVVVDGPVENVDIVPTILDVLGLPAPEPRDGQSLMDLVQAAAEGGQAPGKDVVFSNSSLFTMARQRDGKKLVLPWDAGGPDPAQFLDLALDPREQAPWPPSGGVSSTRLERLIAEMRASALKGTEADTALDDEPRARLQAMGYAGPR